MTIPVFVNAMVSLLSLLILWFLYSFAYRDYRRDVYRQKLFELRNELFDLALAGEISFETPAYQTLRTTINGFIRFAHHMQFGGLAIFIVIEELAKDDTPDVFEQRWDAQTAQLPADVAAKLNRVLMNVHRHSAEQLVLCSPALLVIIIPPLLIIAMKHLGQAVWRKPYGWGRSLIQNRWISALDSAALEEGSLVLG
jgi:hypothetical protein